MPKIDIVIVNWNSGEQLYDCLRSITAVSRDGFGLSNIIVVDNASTDGSADRLYNLDLPLTIIYNDNNRGFAAACNQGAAGSEADYLLFLNPDMQLFENSLSIPMAFMERPENQNIGIVGIQLVDEEGRVSRTCARFPTLGKFVSKILGLDRLFPKLSYFMTDWDHKSDRFVDHVIGAFFLVRKELFEKLNGFDERFFVYFEDLDFSYRAKQSGYSSYYLTSAQAYHKGGGTSNQVKDVRLFYSLRSRMLYGYKHFNWLSATFLTLCTLIVEPITRIVFAVMKGAFVEIIETLKAYKLLWSDIPRMALKEKKSA